MNSVLKVQPPCCIDSARAHPVCVSLCADIEEKGVTMKLTVIDTPGFGDQINNENWSVVCSACATLFPALRRFLFLALSP